VVELENEPYVQASGLVSSPGSKCGSLYVVQPDLAAAWFVKQAHDVQQRALATAGSADYRYKLALFYIHAYASKHMEVLCSKLVELMQFMDFYGGITHISKP